MRPLNLTIELKQIAIRCLSPELREAIESSPVFRVKYIISDHKIHTLEALT